MSELVGELDLEVEAMRVIVAAFEHLTTIEQERVLLWAADRYNVTLPAEAVTRG